MRFFFTFSSSYSIVSVQYMYVYIYTYMYIYIHIYIILNNYGLGLFLCRVGIIISSLPTSEKPVFESTMYQKVFSLPALPTSYQPIAWVTGRWWRRQHLCLTLITADIALLLFYLRVIHLISMLFGSWLLKPCDPMGGWWFPQKEDLGVVRSVVRKAELLRGRVSWMIWYNRLSTRIPLCRLVPPDPGETSGFKELVCASGLLVRQDA